MTQAKTKARRSRIGRKRWGPVIRFLTQLMQTGKPDLQYKAAERLTEIFLAREARELAELRKAEREEKQAAEIAETEPEPNEPLSPEEEARRFLDGLKERENIVDVG